MTCENQVGVKNILISFRDCDTDAVYGPISHELSSEDLPTWRLCAFNNEAMPHGYVKRQPTNPEVEIKVIRDLRVPLLGLSERDRVRDLRDPHGGARRAAAELALAARLTSGSRIRARR